MIAQILRRSSFGVIPDTGPTIRTPSDRQAPNAAAAWRASRAAGGWSFALDPDQLAAASPAIWRPQACAHVTIARPGPKGFAALRLADFVNGSEVAAELIAWHEWHIVLVAGGRRHRLAIRRCDANERLAFLNPADTHAGLRAMRMLDLHRHLLGLTVAGPMADAGIGASERWRLVQWLRLLDAADQGLSSRQIAAVLLLGDVADYSAAEWDASSERKRIARWHRAALSMRDANYRTLLAAP